MKVVLLKSQNSEKEIELFIGPQHPASGHMRFIGRVDGDIFTKFIPDPGWVHRGVEKIAENRKWIQIIPLVERAAILDAANMNIGYVIALERLLDIEAPPRAQYLRTLLCEINRITSHLYGFGIAGIMIGSSTFYMWPFADREPLIDIAQLITGARLTYSYIIPGGVRRDLPQGFKEKALKALKYIERRLNNDYFRLFFDNPVTKARYKEVGVLKKDDAIRLGIVGPNLRASNVKYDVRKVEPYAAYSELEFDIAYREEGDCYARFMVRVEEIKQSIKIIRQILDKIPQGPIIHKKYEKLISLRKLEEYQKAGVFGLPAIFATLRPPAGEVISRVEAARGELIFHIISTGDLRPYRLRMVTPSFRNIVLFRELISGARVMDFPAIYGSIDYFPPESDR
jgi:NADH-quinone oxidoreductase subunit D